MKNVLLMKGDVCLLDENAKQELTYKYFDMIFKLALAQTNDKHHAEDVCQDVFLKFLSCDKSFESEEHIKAWLIRVAINASKSIFTSSWFKKTTPLSEDIVFENDYDSEVFDAVGSLPEKYRIVIHLFYYEGFSISEIAGYIGANENTVKSQLHRAREILKDTLNDVNGGF